MSVTHPHAVVSPVAQPQSGFAERHPHLVPFVVAVAIAVVSIAVSLGFTGLPA